MNKSYTEYGQVPWFRRSRTVSPMVLSGLLLYVASGALGAIAAPIAILPWAACIIVLTGGVYTDKKTPDGTLKTWGAGNKAAAIIILILSTVWAIEAVAPGSIVKR